jgi:hypothetical protein
MEAAGDNIKLPVDGIYREGPVQLAGGDVLGLATCAGLTLLNMLNVDLEFALSVGFFLCNYLSLHLSGF